MSRSTERFLGWRIDMKKYLPSLPVVCFPGGLGLAFFFALGAMAGEVVPGQYIVRMKKPAGAISVRALRASRAATLQRIGGEAGAPAPGPAVAGGRRASCL